MKLWNLISTIKKMDNLEKGFKAKIIIIGTIEWILTGYKLIFIIPTMILIGLEKALDWITDRLDSLCYDLPDVRLAKKEDVQKLTKAIREHNGLE